MNKVILLGRLTRHRLQTKTDVPDGVEDDGLPFN